MVRKAALALALLALGFAAGFAVRHAELLPYRALRALAAERRPPDDAAARRAEAERLATLAYLPGYRAAGEEPGGVVVAVPERMAPGVNLVVSAHRPGAALVAADGRELHEWRCGYDDLRPPAPSVPPGGTWWRRARLLPDGGVLAVIEDLALLRLDRASRVVWSRLELFHHDVDVTPDGRVLTLSRRLVERDGRQVVAEEEVVELSPAGEVVRRVALGAALARSPWAPVARRTAASAEPLHANAVRWLDGRHAALHPAFAAGNLLLSFAALDAVAVLDPASERIVWLLTGLFGAQHDPVLLPSGRLLLFDNSGLGERSRVLELDPLAPAILWSWPEGEPSDFHSRILGSAQRLANGNTLVTESVPARAWEVTPGGEVVWRYDNPHRLGDDGELVATLVTVERLPAAAWPGAAPGGVSRR